MNNDRSINIAISVAVILMLLSLLAGAIMGAQQLDELFITRQTVIHTHEALNALENIYSSTQSAEAWQQCYILSKRQNYLSSYQGAKANVIGLCDRLTELSADSESEHQSAAHLKHLATDYFNQLQEQIDLAKGSRLAVSEAPAQTLGAADRLHKLNSLLLQMEATENSLLDVQTSALTRQAGETLLKQLLLAGLAIAFQLCMSAMVTIFIRARRSVEGQLTAVLTSIAEGVYRLDEHGTITYLNPKAEALLGYKLSDVKGRNMHELVHGGEAGKVLHHESETCPFLARLKKDVVQPVADEQFARKDGTLIPVRYVSAPLVEDGKVHGTVASFHDVTDKQRMESLQRLQHTVTKTLSESSTLREAIERLLKQICLHMEYEAGAFWHLKRDERVLTCLDFWCSPGISMPQFETATLSEQFAVGRGLPGMAAATGKATWLTGVGADKSFRRQAAAKHDGVCTAFAVPIGGTPELSGVLEFFSMKDIPPDEEMLELFVSISNQLGQYFERKKAEEELRDSERRYRSVFDTAPDGILTVGADGKIESANEAAHKILRYAQGELLRKPLSNVIPDLPKQKASRDEQSTTAGAKQLFQRNYQTDAIRKDQSLVPLEVAASNALLRNRELTTLIIRDITERKEVERRVAEFYSIVSHELRTPLTSIRGSLGLLEGGRAGELSKRGFQLVNIARLEADRLIRLINDILDIRKIEAGKLELRIGECTISKLVSTSIASMTGAAATADVELESNIAEDSTIFCDEERIEQVLTNLLSNAIKYSPPKASITVRTTEDENGNVRFSVTDHGCGIPQEQMHRLFGMFQQIDSSDSRPKEGSGLGLAISKAIVEEHKGRIGVLSKDGEGSTFWFELPRGSATPESPKPEVKSHFLESPENKPASQPAPQRNGPVRVLIIEDDDPTRELIKQQFDQLNVQIIEATDGKSAINLARANTPDLIILDVSVPEPDGFEVVNILRRERLSRVPLIVYTARDLTEEDKGQLSLGQTAHLVKSRASQAQLLDTAKDFLAGLTTETPEEGMR
jgi:PAS domain S-box-containing protein